jgi:hypothetical protein
LRSVRERSPGVFYVKGLPFLHFHLKEGRRWADVRAGRTWGPPVEIPLGATAAGRPRGQLLIKPPAPRARALGATAAARRRFHLEIIRRHAVTLAAVSGASAASPAHRRGRRP